MSLSDRYLDWYNLCVNKILFNVVYSQKICCMLRNWSFLWSVISQGKVVALDRWGGKWNHLSMTHRLTAICAKNYCNRTLIVKVIIENVVTCFSGHSVEGVWWWSGPNSTTCLPSPTSIAPVHSTFGRHIITLCFTNVPDYICNVLVYSFRYGITYA